MTQEQFAERLGGSNRSVSRWEKLAKRKILNFWFGLGLVTLLAAVMAAGISASP